MLRWLINCPSPLTSWAQKCREGGMSPVGALRDRGQQRPPARSPLLCPCCHPSTAATDWESQNHRMVGVGGDLCGSPSPTPLPKQGHLQQAVEDLVQAGLEYLQRRRLHKSPSRCDCIPNLPPCDGDNTLPPAPTPQGPARSLAEALAPELLTPAPSTGTSCPLQTEPWGTGARCPCSSPAWPDCSPQRCPARLETCMEQPASVAKQHPCLPRDPHGEGRQAWGGQRGLMEGGAGAGGGEGRGRARLFPTLPPPRQSRGEGSSSGCTSQLTFPGCLILAKPWTSAVPSTPPGFY